MTKSSTSILDQWRTRLRECGWRELAKSSERTRQEAPTDARSYESTVWTLDGTEDEAVGVRLLVANGTGCCLPAPERLFARYLDCPREAKRLVSAHDEAVDYCLLCDNQREYWYDVARDMCLGGEAIVGKAREAIWPLLTVGRAQAGLLEEPTRRSVQLLGRELAAWVSLWVNELGSASGQSPFALRRFFFLLALGRKALGRADAPEAIRSMAKDLLLRDGAEAGRALLDGLPAALDELTRLFPGVLTWNAARDHSWLVDFTSRRGPLVDQLACELPSISSAKVSTDSLVAALGDPAIEPVGWRQSLTTTPEQLERRLNVEGRHVLTPLTIDVETEGFGWLLHCARWAVRYWTRRVAEERERRRDGEAPISWQLDLTMAWPVGVGADGAVDNSLLYALGNTIRVRARKPVNRIAAELILYSLAIEETSEEPEGLPLPLDLSTAWV